MLLAREKKIVTLLMEHEDQIDNHTDCYFIKG